ncbi:MAG: alkaline phosphatase family protein [Polyangiales bacterium]
MARRTHFVRAIALLSSLSLAACGSGINNDDPPDDVADLEDLDWLDGGDWEDDAAAQDMDGSESSAPSADATADRAQDSRTDAAVRDAAVADASVEAGAPGFDFPTPIQHVIVLIRENRTFDHMFSRFPNALTTTTALRHDGTRVNLRPAPNGDLAGDIRHTHNGALQAFNGGRMNGFDLNAQYHSDTGNPLGAFVHYTESQIPNYWRYARNFVLCDHFFSTTLTQSSPGHFTFWTAQVPIIDNPKCEAGCSYANGSGCFARGATVHAINQDTCAIRTSTVAPCFDVPTVVDHFPSTLSWRVYASADEEGEVSSPLAMARGITRNRDAFLAHTFAATQLPADLEAGRQPNLVIAHVGGSVGEHPPHGLCAGENYAVRVINAVMRGPHWRTTAILLTYDDWGGFYDHVRPPQETCSNGDHMHLGFRLPMIIVSPYTRRSTDPNDPYVFHGVTEQSSVPRLIEDVFRLPRMSATDRHARDGRAGSLRGAFDFAHPNFDTMILTPRTCP